MIRWQLMAVFACLGATGGCAHKQLRMANMDLERENFQLEQRLDEVTWQLEDAKSALDLCQRQLCDMKEDRPSSPARRRSPSPFGDRGDRGEPATNNDTEPEAPHVELPDEEMRSPSARRKRHSEPVPRYAGPPQISPPDPNVPDGVLRHDPRQQVGQAAPTLADESDFGAEAPAVDIPADDAVPYAREGRSPHQDLVHQPDNAPATGRGKARFVAPRAAPVGEAPAEAAEEDLLAEPEADSPRPVLTVPAPAEISSDPATARRLPQNSAAGQGPKSRLIAKSGDQRVTTLTINSALTEWRKSKSEPSSDEGLRIVVEPRNAQGEIVEPSGIIAIAVIDPAEEGAAARLARWNFSAEQTQEHFHGIAAGGGLHFSLPWPNAAPVHDDLLLFVRFTSADGQQVVAEMALRPTAVAAPTSWTEPADSAERKSKLHTTGANSVAWKRASTPLPAFAPQTSRPGAAAVTPAEGSLAPAEPPALAPVEESTAPAGETKAETKAEPTGPTWAPYR